MDKRIKWGIIILVGAGLIGGGIYSQMPKQNEDLAAADKVSQSQTPFMLEVSAACEVSSQVCNAKIVSFSCYLFVYSDFFLHFFFIFIFFVHNFLLF